MSKEIKSVSDVKHMDTVLVDGDKFTYYEKLPDSFIESEKRREELARQQGRPFHPNCFIRCSHIPIFGDLGKQFIFDNKEFLVDSLMVGS